MAAKPAPPADTDDTAAPDVMPVALWTAGNGPLQVQAAGLLEDQPELADQLLTAEQWTERLNAYLRSERI